MWILGVFGDVWEVAANSLHVKDVETVFDMPVDDQGVPLFAQAGYEIPESKPSMPEDLFLEVWPDADKSQAYAAIMESAGMCWEPFLGCWMASVGERTYFINYDEHEDYYPHKMGEPCRVRCEEGGAEAYQKPFGTVMEALDYIAKQREDALEPV